MKSNITTDNKSQQEIGEPQHRIPGSLLVFLGAVFWSLNSPIVKFVHMDPLLICFLRSLIAAAVLAPFIRPSKLIFGRWLFVYILCYTMTCITVISALTMTGAPIAVGMQYTSIVWIFAADSIIKRRVERERLVPVVIIITGVIVFMATGIGDARMSGNLLALSSGVFFALMTVSSAKCGTNSVGLVSLGNIFQALVLIPFMPRFIVGIREMSGTEWLLIVILGVVQLGCGYVLYFSGVRRTTSQRATVMAIWEMILGPVWVALIVGEKPGIIEFIGFIIIIIGIILDTVYVNSHPFNEKNRDRNKTS